MCAKCARITGHSLYLPRKCYACQDCGSQVYPTAGTIFHKSPTSLRLWFHAVFLLASTRCGISAKQVQREIGVTYKTAWRMCHLIRQRLDEGIHPMSGHVEVDETYVGGKAKNMHAKKRREKFQGDRGTVAKIPVFGLVERKGNAAAFVVPDVKAGTLIGHILSIVDRGSRISTDEWRSYEQLPNHGYQHGVVKHGKGQYVNSETNDGGQITEWSTNTMEGFWSIIKRAITGVFHVVSRKYLQNYLSEVVFRYNHRNDETPMFRSMMKRMAMRVEGLLSPVPPTPMLPEPQLVPEPT